MAAGVVTAPLQTVITKLCQRATSRVGPSKEIPGYAGAPSKEFALSRAYTHARTYAHTHTHARTHTLT